MYLKKKSGQVRNYQEDGVVPSGKTTLTDEELREKYGKAYDFLKMEDRANKQKRVGSLAGLMDNDMYDMILGLSPEKAAQFMKAAKSYQYSPRIYNQKTEGDHRSGEVNKFSREIDEERLAKEFKKLKKKNYKGHAYDLNVFREIFGNENLTSQQADIMSKQMGTGPMVDALMSINPELDPGASGGAYRSRLGGRSQGFDLFPNAPQEYINNMLASGIITENEDGTYTGGRGNPSQEWLNIQNLAGGGDKNITESQIINNLSSQDDLITEGQFPNNKWNPGRSSLRREAAFEFGVRQNKDGSFYSEGLRRNLNRGEEGRLRNELANEYYDNSGFQLYKPEINVNEVNPSQLTVPSNKTDIGPMPTFINTDIEQPITLDAVQPGTLTGDNQTLVKPNAPNPLTETVSLDFDQMDSLNNMGGGEGQGTGTLNDASNKNAEGKSIDAVTQSWKNRTHIGTGEGYNEGDLDRDAKIIKDTYGDDAYNNLLSKINNMAKPIANNDQSVVRNENTESGSSGGSSNPNLRNISFRGNDNVNNDDGEVEDNNEEVDNSEAGSGEDVDETAGFIDLSNFTGSDLGYTGVNQGPPSVVPFFKNGAKLNKYGTGGYGISGFDTRNKINDLKMQINSFKENMDTDSREDKKALERLEEELSNAKKKRFNFNFG
tara:strand:+ start:1724 stop:3706 length:1983 start_codon:yes stop_codon:yes gene_type:complete